MRRDQPTTRHRQVVHKPIDEQNQVSIVLLDDLLDRGLLSLQKALVAARADIHVQILSTSSFACFIY